MGSGRDGAISATGTAMQEELNEAAMGGLTQHGGDNRGGPIEIATTTGHHHQRTAMGGPGGEMTKRRRRGRRCGPKREQTHGE
jgi:hypothetical protein